MRTEIHFHHMERSEALEAFALEKVNSIVTDFLKRHDSHVQVWLINEHSPTQKGVPQFMCEIEVRYPPKKSLFISKSSDDAYNAVQEAADTLKVSLREESKREVYTRNDRP